MNNPYSICVSSVALFAVSLLWALFSGLAIGYFRGRANGLRDARQNRIPSSSFDGKSVVGPHKPYSR